jgi:hypothetical protein
MMEISRNDPEAVVGPSDWRLSDRLILRYVLSIKLISCGGNGIFLGRAHMLSLP